MPKTINEELVLTYFKDFQDFSEELPNNLSPMISQIFELDSKMLKKLDKIDHKMSKMAKSSKVKHKLCYKEKIERYLRRIKRLSDKKVEISKKIANLIQKSGKQLNEDFRGTLLSDQTNSFTYGTRSGKMWTE